MLQALFNILILMVLYTLSRLFFYLTNLDVFTGVSFPHLMEMMGGGLRFDLTAVLYLSSVYLVMALLPLRVKWRTNKFYTGVQKFFFIFPNAIGLLANTADMAYFRFSDRRTTCAFFTEFNGETNLFSVVLSGIFDYWYYTIFAIAAIALLFILYKPYRQLIPFVRKYYYIFHSVAFLLLLYLTVIGMRSSFRFVDRPLGVNDAMLYANRPAETSLVLNTPFSVMRTIGNTTYENPRYFSDNELEAIFSPRFDTICEPVVEGKPNVMIFILESFGSEHVGFCNPDAKPFTPFLDSLMRNSIAFTHAYSAGRISVDAPPAILSSIPTLYEPFVLSSYATNEISSLASILNERGYHTAFFHGANNGSMGFDAYAHNAGFQNYYGETEYYADPLSDKHPEMGNWGMWDETFFEFFARKSDAMPQPFCATIFTLSSHHPFKIPAKYESVIPKSDNPLRRCIAYTDLALRHFFDHASRQPWFENTIFVFVADHASESRDPEYITDEGIFRIPLAFYIPKLLHQNTILDSVKTEPAPSPKAKRSRRLAKTKPEPMDTCPAPYFQYPRLDTTTVAVQMDILPSLMALLGNTEPIFAFGENILTAPKRHNYAVTFHSPYFQIMSLNGYIQFDGQNVVSVNGNLSPQEQDDMLRFLKAYLQQYVTHLMNNTMH